MLNLDITLDQLNYLSKNTLVENLGIVFTEVGADYVKATMPVDMRTIRPGGILHGGANLALAETLAGLGSLLMIDPSQMDVKGIQISGNHTGSISEGMVIATARIVHAGKQTHVWDVRIESENGRLLSTERVTNMIVPRNDK